MTDPLMDHRARMREHDRRMNRATFDAFKWPFRLLFGLCAVLAVCVVVLVAVATIAAVRWLVTS